MRFTGPLLLAATTLLGCPPVADLPSDADTCEASALPTPDEVITTPVRLYNPVAACWRSVDVELDAAIWSAYDPSAGVECNDIVVVVARVDCSCLILPGQCGNVSDALASDPGVVWEEDAEQRCRAFEMDAPECD